MDPYAESGVHLGRAEEAVARLRPIAERTRTPAVVAGVGGFAAAVRLSGYREPLVVTATDGVGTKLLLAKEAGEVRGLGRDLAGMVLNDLACLGAEPLAFLDYVGVGVLDPAEVERLVDSLAEALAEAGCPLVGGEIAEMPGLYRPGDFDFVGFAVGVVEAGRLVTPRGEAGDVLLALPASGLHANGFSLVRRILGDHPELRTTAFLGELLTPTRLYVGAALALARELGDDLHGLCHVTGGGLPGNLPRCLRPGRGARLRLPPEPEVSLRLRRAAGLRLEEVFAVWNLGVGFVAALPPARAEAALALLESRGERPFLLGRVSEGGGVVVEG